MLKQASNIIIRDLSSVGGITTRYGLDGWGSNPGGGTRCSVLHTRPYRSWGPPSFLYNGYRIGCHLRRDMKLTTIASSAEVRHAYSCNCTPLWASISMLWGTLPHIMTTAT
jgi:hypothetical protein